VLTELLLVVRYTAAIQWRSCDVHTVLVLTIIVRTCGVGVVLHCEIHERDNPQGAVCWPCVCPVGTFLIRSAISNERIKLMAKWHTKKDC
jgi:hypothetical protein